MLMIVLVLMLMPTVVCGHGYLESPRSRNLVAYEDKTWSAPASTDPFPEDCPHCLNLGGTLGQCGIKLGWGLSRGKLDQSYRDYDVPLNVHGDVMPRNIQADYSEGQIVTLASNIVAYHRGHLEFRACPIAWGEAPTKECFEQHPLEFVEDVLYGSVKDERYPERAYLAPTNVPPSQAVNYDGYSSPTGAQDPGMRFVFRMKLPDGLSGDLVLLQWYYLTANTCKHDGYDDYQFPIHWGRGVYYSTLPYCGQLPEDGRGVPEQFWNCAEVSISKGTTEIAQTNESTDPPITLTPLRNPTESPSPVVTSKVPLTQSTSPTRSYTQTPTGIPTKAPTTSPTTTPTSSPIVSPTTPPTTSPTKAPTTSPTDWPTLLHTSSPSAKPTMDPTAAPFTSPTVSPMISLKASPTKNPTAIPTKYPTAMPIVSTTPSPTLSPIEHPYFPPTTSPFAKPTRNPTEVPSLIRKPTPLPTTPPNVTDQPTIPMPTTPKPTKKPTDLPSIYPRSLQPTPLLSTMPSFEPTSDPITISTLSPITRNHPTDRPTESPKTTLPAQTETPTTSPTPSPMNKDANSIKPFSRPTTLPTIIYLNEPPTRFPTKKPSPSVTPKDRNGPTSVSIARPNPPYTWNRHKKNRDSAVHTPSASGSTQTGNLNHGAPAHSRAAVPSTSLPSEVPRDNNVSSRENTMADSSSVDEEKVVAVPEPSTSETNDYGGRQRHRKCRSDC